MGTDGVISPSSCSSVFIKPAPEYDVLDFAERQPWPGLHVPTHRTPLTADCRAAMKLKLNRLRQRQPVPLVTKERSAALIGKARAAPTGEQKRNRAAPARKH
jgi:hypothetical protein